MKPQSAIRATILYFFLVPPTNSVYQPHLPQYIASLIKFRASQQINSTFDCWFYFACGIHPPDSRSQILQEILHALGDDIDVVRLVLNSLSEFDRIEGVLALPSLVVIHLQYDSRDGFSAMERFGLFLGLLPSDTKLVILANTAGRMKILMPVVPLMYAVKMLNVVFVSTNVKLFMYSDFYGKRIVKLLEYPRFEELFVDVTRDLHGHGIQFGAAKRSMSNVCLSEQNCFGYDIYLVQAIARFMNGTIRYIPFICEEEDLSGQLFDCVRDLTYDVDCEFDFFAETTSSGQYLNFYVDVPIPVDDAFLVPRGRQLNIVELFLKPFCPELWIVLFVGLIILKGICLIVPTEFQNDVLLLPICGFERFNLNQAPRREKFVMISLIILFFVISNAYETKIISLMTNRPSIRTVEKLQDFLLYNMHIKIARERAPKLTGFERLLIFRNDSDLAEDRMDGTSAYLTNSIMARLLLERSENWDFSTNQPRYKILDESLGMMVAFYPVPQRSAIRPWFRFVQRTLFEAGILGVWRKQTLQMMAGGVLGMGMVRAGCVNPTAEVIVFVDLIPVWCVLGFGCTAGLCVFLLELLMEKFKGLKLPALASKQHFY